MADIPIFSGSAGSLPSIAPDSGIDRLDVNAYLRGAQGAQFLPSDTTSLVRGVQGAVETYQNYRQNEAQIGRTEAQTAAFEQQAELAPYQADTARIQAETAQARASLEAQLMPMKALSEYQQVQTESLKAKVEASKFEVEQRATQTQLAQQKSATDALKLGLGDDLNVGISALEKALPDVIDNGVTTTKSGDPTPDQATLYTLNNLASRAERTGDPELAARANNLRKAFYDGINTQSGTKRGFEVQPPAQQAQPQQTQPQQAPQGGGQQPQQGQEAPYAQFNQRSYAQQGQQSQAPSQDLASIKRQIQNEPGGSRMTPAQIETAALARLQNQQVAQRMQPFEFKDYEKLQTSAVQYGVMADKADSAMSRLDIITKKYLNDPEFGKANKAGAFWQGLAAAVKNNAEDAAIVQEVKAELNSLGGYQALLAVSADLGMGQQVINTQDERELIMGMFTGEQASIDRNKQAVALLRAKAGEARDIASLTNGLLQGGKRYQEAKIIANDYRLNNRSTTVRMRDTEYGYQMPYVDVERGRKSTSEYLSEIFGSNARQGRDQSGRVISAPPSTPDDIDKLLPQGNDTTLLKQQMKQTSGTDIPEFQPRGVSSATLLRTAQAESSGNPQAEGPDTSTGTAKGLVQLKDATGEKLWSLYKKDFGLTGAYDPKDAVQNLSLAQYHMNELLPKYNGDTRQMLAAYHLGEPEFNKILNSAKGDKRAQQRGGVDWPILRDHLKDKGRSEVATYIADIMGDGKPPGPQLANNFTQAQVIDKLPTPQAQEFAQTNLTPRGMEMLSQVTGANKIEDVQGTFLADYLSAMFAPLLGLVTPQDANAEEPEGDSPPAGPSASPTPSQTPSVGPSPSPTPSPAPGPSDSGVPSNEPMPSPGSAPPGGSSPASVSKALADLIPLSIQASTIGATNAALMGGDDEAMAGLLVMMGEEYEPAVRRVRAIRDEFQQNYPTAFNGGWYAGVPMGMFGTGMAVRGGAATVRGARALTGTAKVAPQAAEVARQTAGQIVKKGMAGGAGYGAAGGFLQGEEGVGNRVESALQGGAVGGLIGTGLGGAIAGSRAAIQSGPTQRTIARIRGKSAPAPEKMNRGGEALSERLEGVPTQRLQDTEQRLNVPGNETLLADELQNFGNTGQFIDAASKIPKTSGPLQELAEGRSKARPRRIRDFMRSQQVPGARTKPLQKVAQEEVDSQPERLRQIVGQATKVVDEGEESFTRASTTAQNKNTEIRLDRQTKAGPVYDQAMDELANPKTGIPEFTGKDIKFLTEKDAVISDAIDAALGRPGLGDLPRNSVRVVREARDILDSQAQSGSKQRAIGTRTQGGIRSYEAGQAADRLTTAMRSKSPTLARADTLYREGSGKLRDFNTRMSRQLQKFARADTSDDVTKLGDYLFGRKPQQLREFKANFSPDEWADFQEATGAHLIKQFETKGKFVDFSKNYGAENLEVIFGKTKAAQIVKQFGKEAERFDVVKKVAEAKDVGKHLMSMQPDQLKKTLRSFTPAQAEAAEKDVERYVMNEIGKAPERVEGSSQAFPKFSKDFGREKFQIVFGKDRGNAIMKRFQQERKASITDSRITSQGSQTAMRGQEASVAERAGFVGSALAKLGIRGKFGLASAGRDLVEAVKNSAAMREQVEQAAEILLIDPKKGPEFLRKEIANRLAKEKLTVDNKAINQFIELATKQASKASKRVTGIGGSSAVANESSRYSEEYQSQREQMQE